MKRWLVSSISFASLLVATLVPRTLLSCADGGDWGYRFSSFLPFIHYKPVYASFNFCAPLFYDTENKAGIESDRQRNINEWLAYLKNEVTREAVYQVLYATPPSVFERIATGGRAAGDSALVANAFMQWMLHPEHHAVKEYMRYAKYSEVISSMMGDPWEEDVVEDVKADAFMKNWQAVYDRTQDVFLRERYGFQFLRLNFYLGNYAASRAEYERSFAGSTSKSVLRPWAEEYYAMVFRYGEDRITANYHLAQSFAACDDKKVAAVMYFTRDSLEATLDLAKTDNERFNILATAATNDPIRHLHTLQTLYRLQPENDLLEMLVTREINKCEDWVLSYTVSGSGPSVRPSMPEVADWSDWETAYRQSVERAVAQDVIYLKDVTSFVDRVVAEGKAPNTAFWTLAASYCHFLIDDVAGAKQLLARHRTFKTKLFSETADVLDLMLRARLGEFDASFEQDLMKVHADLLADEKYDDRHHLADQLKMYVAYAYARHGDFIRAALISSIGRYMNEYSPWITRSVMEMVEKNTKGDYVRDFVALATKPNKTTYEAFLTKTYPVGSRAYYDLLDQLGTVYLRQYNFRSADSVFTLVPDSVWNDRDGWASSYATYLNQNPFVARFGSNHHNWQADTVTYSKKAFAREMLKLQGMIADPNTRNRDVRWREYADAFFNMTFYGNSWLYVRNGWSRSEIDGYSIESLQRRLTQDDLNYYGCRAARIQYAALYNATRNTEIKAHCAMMISRCDRNLAYIKSKNPDEFKYKGDQYLTKFLTQYKKTDTYKQAFDECADLDAFMYWTKRVIE